MPKKYINTNVSNKIYEQNINTKTELYATAEGQKREGKTDSQ